VLDSKLASLSIRLVRPGAFLSLHHDLT